MTITTETLQASTDEVGAEAGVCAGRAEGRPSPLMALTLGAWLDAQADEDAAAEASPFLDRARSGDPPDIEVEEASAEPPSGEVERTDLLPEEQGGGEAAGLASSFATSVAMSDPDLVRDCDLKSALTVLNDAWEARATALEARLAACDRQSRQSYVRLQAELQAPAALAALVETQANENGRQMRGELARLTQEVLRLAGHLDVRLARLERALAGGALVDEDQRAEPAGPSAPQRPWSALPESLQEAEADRYLFEDEARSKLDSAPPAESLFDHASSTELRSLVNSSKKRGFLGVDPSEQRSPSPVDAKSGSPRAGRKALWSFGTAVVASGAVAVSAAPSAQASGKPMAAAMQSPSGPANIVVQAFSHGARPPSTDGDLASVSDAAELGVVQAQLRLAELYEDGRLVQRNPEMARVWTARAAEAGSPTAMHNLALYCLEGSGGPQCTEQALMWFRRAAANGVADSAFNVAKLSSG